MLHSCDDDPLMQSFYPQLPAWIKAEPAPAPTRPSGGFNPELLNALKLGASVDCPHPAASAVSAHPPRAGGSRAGSGGGGGGGPSHASVASRPAEERRAARPAASHRGARPTAAPLPQGRPSTARPSTAEVKEREGPSLLDRARERAGGQQRPATAGERAERVARAEQREGRAMARGGARGR